MRNCSHVEGDQGKDDGQQTVEELGQAGIAADQVFLNPDHGPYGGGSGALSISSMNPWTMPCGWSVIYRSTSCILRL